MNQSCFTRIPLRSPRAARPFGYSDHVAHTSSRCVCVAHQFSVCKAPILFVKGPVLAGVYVRISLLTFPGTFQKSSWESSHKRNYRLIPRVISFYLRVVPCSFCNLIGVCFTFLLTGGSVPALSFFVSSLMRTGFPPSLLVYVDLITAFCQISRESKHFGVEYHRCSELLKKISRKMIPHTCVNRRGPLAYRTRCRFIPIILPWVCRLNLQFLLKNLAPKKIRISEFKISPSALSPRKDRSCERAPPEEYSELRESVDL